MPGVYTAKLTVDGKSFTQTFTIKMDPRVKTSVADLQKQHDLSLQCYTMRRDGIELQKQVHAFRTELQSQLAAAGNKEAEKFSSLEKQAAALEGAQGFGFRRGGQGQEPSFGRLNNSFAGLLNLFQESDRPPTSQAVAAFNNAKKQFDELLRKWTELKEKL